MITPPAWGASLRRDPRFQEELALRAFGERDVAAVYRGLLGRAREILGRLPSVAGG
jgi:hypothetical protein